jgi:hypothetical protein
VLSLVLIGQGVLDLQGVNFGLLPLTDRPVLTTFASTIVQQVMWGIQFCGEYLSTSLFTLVKFGSNLPFKWSQTSLPVPNRINIHFSRTPTSYYSNTVSVFNIPLDVTHLLHCGDVHMYPGPSSDQHSDDLQHIGIPYNDLQRTHNGDQLRIVYTAAYLRFLRKHIIQTVNSYVQLMADII